MTARLEAITRAGAVLAGARAERDSLPSPEAVARWACPAGTDEDRKRIAGLYRLLHDDATQDGPSAA